jgi:hypothetical protein
LGRVVEVEIDNVVVKVAVYRAKCRHGTCFIAAYMYRGVPRLIIVPSPPSPLCSMAKLSAAEAEIVERAIYVAYRLTMPYRFPFCVVPRTLLRDSISATLDHLKLLGLIEDYNGG